MKQKMLHSRLSYHARPAYHLEFQRKWQTEGYTIKVDTEISENV